MRAALLMTTLLMAGCAATAERDHAGASTSAIIGGTVDTGHAYVVGVGSASRAFCTGTVIGKRTVLTAGHCVAAGIQAIYIGARTGGADVEKIAVETTVRHPDYRTTTGKPTNDLAILKLAADAPMEPAPLFRGTMDNSPAFVGPELTWVGFGDDTLGAETSGFGTKRSARFAVSRVGAAEVGGTSGAIDDTMFWYDVPGVSMCHGDSGGPVLFTQNGVEHVIGVTSFGDPSCASDGLAARADAPQIAAFIQPNLDAFESQ